MTLPRSSSEFFYRATPCSRILYGPALGTALPLKVIARGLTESAMLRTDDFDGLVVRNVARAGIVISSSVLCDSPLYECVYAHTLLRGRRLIATFRTPHTLQEIAWPDEKRTVFSANDLNLLGRANVVGTRQIVSFTMHLAYFGNEIAATTVAAHLVGPHVN